MSGQSKAGYPALVMHCGSPRRPLSANPSTNLASPSPFLQASPRVRFVGGYLAIGVLWTKPLDCPMQDSNLHEVSVWRAKPFSVLDNEAGPNDALGPLRL